MRSWVLLHALLFIHKKYYRHHAIEKGIINKKREPFSIRLKQFWELPMSHQLLGEKFAKTLVHEPDGLIFQPSKEVRRYTY